MVYILIIRVGRDIHLNIGKLGRKFFKKGYYCYIGSAMKGWIGRIKRHRREDKRKHWHIDYLTEKFPVEQVFIKKSPKEEESRIAQKMQNFFEFIEGFGSSDTHNRSHLFYSEKKEKILSFIKEEEFYEISNI